MPQWLVIGISGVTCGGKTTLAHALRDYFQGQHGAQLWNTLYKVADVQLISQDDYFLPIDDLRHKWNDKLNAINFELITSLDMKQMTSDIAWTMKGQILTADSMDNIDYINEISMYSNFEHYTPMHSSNHHSYNQGHAQHISVHHHTQQYQQKHTLTIKQNHNPQYSQYSGSRQANSGSHGMRVNYKPVSNLRDTKINILIIEGFMIFNQPELLSLCDLKFHLHLPYEKCFERRRKRTYDPPDGTGYFEICVWPHYEKNFSEYRERKDISFLNGEISKERILKFVLQKIGSFFEERYDISCPPPQKFLGMLNNWNNSTIKKRLPIEQQ